MLKTSDLAGASKLAAPRLDRPSSDGRWVPALPIAHPDLWYRLKDAWAVLLGRAQAIQEG